MAKPPTWTDEMKAKAKATRAATKERKLADQAKLIASVANQSSAIQTDPAETVFQSEESAVKPLKVSNKFKSPELQVFEQSGKIAAGRPSFNVYKKERGAYWFVGRSETNTAEEIGTEYGGGRFEIRSVNQATGFEEVGQEKSFTLAIHPTAYPEITTLPLKAGPDEEVTALDIEEAEARGKEKAFKEFEVETLRRRLLEPPVAQPASDPIAMFAKFMELQKLSAPAPEIGPKKSMTEIIAEVSAAALGAITAGVTIYKTLKSEIKPTSVPEAAAGIGEKMLLGLVENLMTKGTAPQAAGQNQAGEAPAVTEKDQTEMLQELAMELAKQQGIEANTKQDTVLPMASWILSQTGMVWGMLKKNIQDSDSKQVVAFVAAQMPSLADTEFKMKWLSQVVEVVKRPELAQPKAETEGK